MISKSFVLFYSFKKEIKMILFSFPIYIPVLALNDWAVHVIPKSMNKQKCKKNGTFWQFTKQHTRHGWCFASWTDVVLYCSKIAPIHRTGSNKNPSIGKSITGKGWVAIWATNRQFLQWQTLFQPNSKSIRVHSQFWPHEDTIYLRKELNGSKIMHEAISILFGSNLPNLKNEENMLSHSIYNAF